MIRARRSFGVFSGRGERSFSCTHIRFLLSLYLTAFLFSSFFGYVWTHIIVCLCECFPSLFLNFFRWFCCCCMLDLVTPSLSESSLNSHKYTMRNYRDTCSLSRIPRSACLLPPLAILSHFVYCLSLCGLSSAILFCHVVLVSPLATLCFLFFLPFFLRFKF